MSVMDNYLTNYRAASSTPMEAFIMRTSNESQMTALGKPMIPMRHNNSTLENRDSDFTTNSHFNDFDNRQRKPTLRASSEMTTGKVDLERKSLQKKQNNVLQRYLKSSISTMNYMNVRAHRHRSSLVSTMPMQIPRPSQEIPSRLGKKYIQKFSQMAGADLALPGIDHNVVETNPIKRI